MRTSEPAKRPVVTYAGDDVAQAKDVVYAGDGGHVSGFTLAGRGLFAGPKHEVLPWSQVAALGVDAVMVVSEAAFADASALSGDAGGEGDPGDVLGSQVLTDAGTALGTVVDVVLEVPTEPGGACDVVGYEIEASEALGTKGTKPAHPAARHARGVRRAPRRARERPRLRRPRPGRLRRLGAGLPPPPGGTGLMRFSDASGHKIVSTASADTLGKVDEPGRRRRDPTRRRGHR
nr:PRC-barrel domain-containing protein [Angustibacter aerolatus]